MRFAIFNFQMSIKELDTVQMPVAETIKYLGARSHEERN